MITPEKIEEWLKEVEERPSSAQLILRYIANRLRSLNERNEELLEENIALRTGERVAEYEQRIAHLEYQLALLKRQYAGELPSSENFPADGGPFSAAADTISLLLVGIQGHVLHLEIGAENLADGRTIARLPLESTEEPVNLLVVPSTEELLSVYTSGRVVPYAVGDIPAVSITGEEKALSWQEDHLPGVAHAGDTLACIAPISSLALSEYFIQVSRRGYVKKLSTAMAASILSNRYIGTGVKQPADQTFKLFLCREEDRIALVSREGYLLSFEISALPFSIEEVMRTGSSDYLVGAFVMPLDHELLVMTETGKVIHRTGDYLASAEGYKVKGKGLYSQKRRDEGVRVIDASAVREADWGAALHADGRITLHAVEKLGASGAIKVGGKLLAFSTFSIPFLSR